MITKINSRKVTATKPGQVTTRDRLPFAWLEPITVPLALPADAAVGLRSLRDLAEDDVTALMRNLVQFTVIACDPSRRTFTPTLGVSVINRRLRAARLWINAILAGDISPQTLHTMTHTWLPQLAGTGPEAFLAARVGRTCIEFLRGALTASLFDAPAENLVYEAKGLHALETVLAVHLQAIRSVVAETGT